MTNHESVTTFVIRHSCFVIRLLLFLFRMRSVPAEAWRILRKLQLLAAHLAAQRVVIVAGLVADEKHGLHLLLFLTASHDTNPEIKVLSFFWNVNDCKALGRDVPG